MLLLQNVSYQHPNKEWLFSNINLAVNTHEKIALVGNNGTGKSTLLRMIAGELAPAGGTITNDSKPYYIPQHFGQFNDLTIAQALRIEDKLTALHQVLKGDVSEANLELLHDDWTIEERCATALQQWNLENLDLSQEMNTLSGGQKTKVFLAGISIHQPQIVLMDEPTNHLDAASRELLYRFIQEATMTLIVVSHDRTLLNLLPVVCELHYDGITVYGGNYQFYREQKLIENNALNEDVKAKEKALRKAKETERASLERQQKLNARGKKKQEKAGVPTIFMNTLRNNAEKSTAKLKDAHTGKIDGLSSELSELRKELPGVDQMRLTFDDASLHKGKVLITAEKINFQYSDQPLWTRPLSFEIRSGERLALKGGNGSGKTTLIKIMLDELQPTTGHIYRALTGAVYIDQDYSLIDNDITVYQQLQRFNTSALQEHELKIYLSRFLFSKEAWDKPCVVLSGGEKMRLVLCCLVVSNKAPGMIVLDEPTNNLDVQNIEILTAAIRSYQGTLVVVSHDKVFLEETGVTGEMILDEIRGSDLN
ncbi:MAG TPA: ABC-F family ATP-binding cassette domain-containing protein [Flavisolibacter sp.]